MVDQMMEIGSLELATLASTTIAVLVLLNMLKSRYKRRFRALSATKVALSAHYAALEQVVDDPALPVGALEALVEFSDAIHNPEACEVITDFILAGGSNQRRLKNDPAWFVEMYNIQRTRPDLFENFNKAIGSGIVAMFLRWPSTASKFELVMAELLDNRRKEAQLAERIRSFKPRTVSGFDDGPQMPNGMAIA